MTDHQADDATSRRLTLLHQRRLELEAAARIRNAEERAAIRIAAAEGWRHRDIADLLGRSREHIGRTIGASRTR
jgi:DNA-directed RNA polymerase specialized sigma24 family protein